MRDVSYAAYVEYSTGVIGFIGDDFESADEAEKAVRERLASPITAEYIEREHGGVTTIFIRESKEVRRIEL